MTVLERSPSRAEAGGGGLGVDVPLLRYQELRLGPAARHVAVSERATAGYLARAAGRGQ